ncbi:MAG: hypothetical protein AAGB31_15020 [Bdellovibrio sp.]
MKVFIFMAGSLLLQTAQAQIFNSSVAAATGGSGRAAVEPGDTVFLNPATLVHLRDRYFFTSFANDEFAVLLSDSTKESLVPAGLSYVQKKSDVQQGELVLQDISMSLAEFAMNQVAMGLTGHYYQYKIEGGASHIQSNVDIGFMYTPMPDLGLAVVGYNLFGEDKDIPENYRLKRSVGAGINYVYQSLARFRLDATTESVWMAGFESYVNKFIVVRLGYSHDTDDNRELLTAGAGFKGPRFAINYGYQGNSQNSGDYRHSVDLEIPF